MSQTNTPEAPAAPSRRGRLLRGLLAIVVLLLAAFALWYFAFGRWFEETDDAYVQGNQVQITPQVAGTVVAIAADDGMRVERGQLLVQLDPADTEVALQQAEANLARTVRQVRGLYRSVEGAQAELNARQVSLKRARDDFARRKDLATTGAISNEELAHARDELAAAEAAVAGSRETFERSRALVDDTVVATQPDVKAAAAQLRQAWINKQRTQVISPIDGFVAKRTVQLGQRIAPGTPLMAVIPLQDVWVDANFKETQLKKLRLGQRVELTSELYGDDVVFHGKLQSLGLGTGSAFSILPAQNASGNWIKIVQRVPVRVQLDSKELHEHPLRLGLSMMAKVNLRDKGEGLLPTAPMAAPVQGTTAYDKQQQDADAQVNAIIDANLGNARD